MKLLPKVFTSDEQRARQIERELLQLGADIGGQLFGPVPNGRHRQFFCLDERTWIWHEEWADNKGKKHIVTTRYFIRPTGVLKSQDDGRTYQPISREEARNLFQTTELYRQRVGAEYQRLLQTA